MLIDMPLGEGKARWLRVYEIAVIVNSIPSRDVASPTF